MRARDFMCSAVGIFTILFFPLATCASGILLDDYRGGLSPRWQEKVFKGKTRYEVTLEEGQWCIKATSRGSASALYYKIRYDIEEYPILTWRWKVNGVLKKGNALKREGDDYPARLFVVFPSPVLWKTEAINYIWANRLPKGEAMPNPFSANNVMIAVQSGQKHVGQWMEEKRNIFEDYRKCFQQDPPKAGAIAIMTDTDNTGDEAVAWYGPIRILPDSSPRMGASSQPVAGAPPESR